MPIYAYRCAACGHAKDVLQRISDPLLTACPACGAEAFQKQVTAAGFQLKGSGWYVTDFRGDAKAGKPAEADAGAASNGDAAKGEGAKGEGAKTDAGKVDKSPAETTKSDAGGAKTPLPATPAAAPAPSAPASGAGSQ